MAEIFSAIDLNNDGYLFIHELRKVLFKVKGLKCTNLDETFLIMDKDKDNRISYNEFL